MKASTVTSAAGSSTSGMSSGAPSGVEVTARSMASTAWRMFTE